MEKLNTTKNIFLISDSHFGHTNIIQYCSRPFSSIEEMDETIITNWNKMVGKNDIVFHLGDFALPDRRKYPTGNDQDNRIRELISQLNGKITIVFGSHDKQANNCKNSFFKYYHKNQIVEYNINGQIIELSHVPLLSWEKRAHGSLSAFGHVHSGPNKYFLCAQGSWDVGVDNNDYNPIPLDIFIEKAKSNERKLSIDMFDNSPLNYLNATNSENNENFTYGFGMINNNTEFDVPTEEEIEKFLNEHTILEN